VADQDLTSVIRAAGAEKDCRSRMAIEKKDRKIIFKNLVPIFDRNVPHKPLLVGGVKGQNMNNITMPGSPAL
jgi:hypothetical protein